MRSKPSPTSTPKEAETLARVQSRQAGGSLQAIDLTPLHAPPIASGWAAFLGAVRNQSTLPADIREVSILRCGSSLPV